VVNSYFTLRALVREWKEDLVGCTLEDAFSQVKNELSLALVGNEDAWVLKSSTQRPRLYIFRTDGIAKARRNVATLFEDAFGKKAVSLRIADRDRVVSLDLADGSRVLWQLFGARANVFYVAPDDTIIEAFQGDEMHAGTAAPTPRPAPMPDTFDAFDERWPNNRNKTRQAVQSAVPLFGKLLARETLHRAGVQTAVPENCTEDERRALFEAAMALCNDLESPAPILYGTGPFPDAVSLIPLRHRADEPAERVDTVDTAVRDYVRRMLAEQHFHRLYDPLKEALEDAVEHYRTSADRMADELSNESRAERYERWGHLLMAQQDQVSEGADEAEVSNLFEDGAPVRIPLDPAKTPVENAEHYYRRARRTRRSREEAENRLDETLARAEEAEQLLATLCEIETLDGIKRFRKENEDALAPYLDRGGAEGRSFPFRRFDLGEGFEVWVGKNARQNHELTFHTAQKYDLWLHAREVPGGHTVLHLPNRDAEPGKRRIHAAAAIAAYYSKARNSRLVPVMVTERKYVTSPKGADPGVVRVDREDVVMVKPALPE